MSPSSSIRTRIAISIFALSSGLLILMSALVYIAFERQLRTSLDDTLRLQAAAILELVDTTRVPPALAVGVDPGHERATGEAVLRLYSRDGTMLEDSSPAAAAAAGEHQVVTAALEADRNVYRTVELSDHEDYRILASPVRREGNLAGVLVTGIEWSRVNQPLETLRITLSIAVAITAAVLACGAYLVARRALQPVAAIAATARRITQGDLHQRIASMSSRDELGELTHTLNSMIGRLAETVDRDRRFTADASHELRTPLATIETGIDVTLAQVRDPAEYRRVLGVIREQTQGLSALARQLLLLSRLDAQDLRSAFEPIELTELVETVVDSFRDAHPDAIVEFSPNEALQVQGEVELLARALINILENAVAHVGASVRLAVGVRRGPIETALITIADDGPGVGALLAESIFLRFRRGDASRGGGGTGLGLAIVESIMHAHGGRAQLLPSREGEGARFALTLPLISAAGGTPVSQTGRNAGHCLSSWAIVRKMHAAGTDCP
jgi:two-component system OmpR family sensor kinase